MERSDSGFFARRLVSRRFSDLFMPFDDDAGDGATASRET